MSAQSAPWGAPLDDGQALTHDYQPSVWDLLHIQELWDECASVQAGVALARQIEETDTRNETPAPSNVRALFPIWGNAASPLHDALLAVAA